MQKLKPSLHEKQLVRKSIADMEANKAIARRLEIQAKLEQKKQERGIFLSRPRFEEALRSYEPAILKRPKISGNSINNQLTEKISYSNTPSKYYPYSAKSSNSKNDNWPNFNYQQQQQQNLFQQQSYQLSQQCRKANYIKSADKKTSFQQPRGDHFLNNKQCHQDEKENFLTFTTPQQQNLKDCQQPIYNLITVHQQLHQCINYPMNHDVEGNNNTNNNNEDEEIYILELEKDSNNTCKQSSNILRPEEDLKADNHLTDNIANQQHAQIEKLTLPQAQLNEQQIEDQRASDYQITVEAQNVQQQQQLTQQQTMIETISPIKEQQSENYLKQVQTKVEYIDQDVAQHDVVILSDCKIKVQQQQSPSKQEQLLDLQSQKLEDQQKIEEMAPPNKKKKGRKSKIGGLILDEIKDFVEAGAFRFKYDIIVDKKGRQLVSPIRSSVRINEKMTKQQQKKNTKKQSAQNKLVSTLEYDYCSNDCEQLFCPLNEEQEQLFKEISLKQKVKIEQ